MVKHSSPKGRFEVRVLVGPQNMQNDRWAEYYKNTAQKPPSKLLMKALEYVKGKTALDIGAGGFNDSVYLLSQGFTVTAVDSSPTSLELSKKINDPQFTFVNSTYDSFSFELEKYDLISAQWALPFNEPETFNIMFEKLKVSLKINGIFVGQFFGIKDEWNVPEKRMTFHTKEQVEDLLKGMHVIELREEEKDGTTASGNAKHWHIFHVIAERK